MAHPQSNKTLYQPLDEARREIRLVEVISAAPAQADITLKFHSVSLLDKPRFCALSYVWGDSSSREPVTLNGETVQVTKNLARAFCAVKYHYKKMHPFRQSSKFRVWADAICINQDDLEERGKQVQMMGSIYHDAEIVFASLSPSDELDDATIELSFDVIHLMHRELKRIQSETKLLELKWISKHKTLRTEDEDAAFGNSSWDALWYFQNSEYFQRAWVRQEVCLAKNLIFIHGASAVNFSIVSTVCSGIDLAGKHLLATVTENYGDQSSKRISPAITDALMSWDADTILDLSSYKAQIARQDPFTLRERWGISLMGTETIASNPKDYIYGFLGLNGLDITPDYTANTSLGQVYAQYITRWLVDSRAVTLQDTDNVQSFPDLNLELWFIRLGGLGLSSEKYGVPSWAPAYHKLDPLKTYLIPREDACAKLPMLLTAEGPNLQGLDLLASGIVLDKIASIMVDSVIDMMNDKRMIEFCADYLGRSRTEDGTARLLEPIFRASVLNSELQPDRTFLADVLAWLSCLVRREGVSEDSQLKLLGLVDSGRFTEWLLQKFSSVREEEVSRLGGSLPMQSSAQHRKVQVPITLLGRQHRLVETTRGYLGHAPSCAKPGDVIVILKGSPLPSVLRKVDDYYLHVGCCWVYEYVIGNVEKQFAEENLKVERFVIR
jgi:hypothetical protein